MLGKVNDWFVGVLLSNIPHCKSKSVVVTPNVDIKWLCVYDSPYQASCIATMTDTFKMVLL